MPHIEIIGVYPVQTPEPVHLVELRVLDAKGAFKVGDITQEVPGQPRSNWQAPYLEHVLDAAGQQILAGSYKLRSTPELWQGTMRMVFFFHYLDLQRPFRTPFGDVQLPAATQCPERLSMIQYEQP